MTSQVIELAGTVEGDINYMTVQSAGGVVLYPLVQDGQWSIDVELSQGDNEITVVAHPADEVCEPLQKKLNLTYSTTQPTFDLSLSKERVGSQVIAAGDIVQFAIAVTNQ